MFCSWTLQEDFPIRYIYYSIELKLNVFFFQTSFYPVMLSGQSRGRYTQCAPTWLQYVDCSLIVLLPQSYYYPGVLLLKAPYGAFCTAWLLHYCPKAPQWRLPVCPGL